MKKRTLQIVTVLVLLTVMAGLAQESHRRPAMTNDDPNWSALMRSTEHMHIVMSSVKPSGDSDVDFVKLMLPHHQAAIDMAKIQLANGNDSQIRRLAQEIVTDQQSEIVLMQLWLKQRENGSRRQGQKPAFDPNQEK
ncbi:MAG TPA: DUF305 domain-containing protein [Terriglobia bacterium]|nr:DUF305 domain-containing protein [Terriglobia bacterium]